MRGGADIGCEGGVFDLGSSRRYMARVRLAVDRESSIVLTILGASFEGAPHIPLPKVRLWVARQD